MIGSSSRGRPPCSASAPLVYNVSRVCSAGGGGVRGHQLHRRLSANTFNHQQPTRLQRPPPSSVTLTFHNPDIPPSHSPPSILPLRRSPSLLSRERLFLLKGTRQTGQTLSSLPPSVFQARRHGGPGSPSRVLVRPGSWVQNWDGWTIPRVFDAVPLWLMIISLTRR